MRVFLLRFALLLSAFTFSCTDLRAQAVPATGTAAAAGGTGPVFAKPDPYASESIVLERADLVYWYAADGTGWWQRTIVVRVQSEAAVKQLGVIAIPFAGASERVEIQYARVRRSDGTVVETPVADAMELPEEVTRQAPFYSDLKQKQIPIRNLRVGDRLEWQAKIVRTKAEAANEFWGQESFDEDAVALEESVELRVPKSKVVKVWSPTMKPVESVEGEERVYKWSNSQTKTTASQQAETEAKKKMPWTAAQELDAKAGKLPVIAWTTFPSWEAVGAWYRGMEGDRMMPSAEVKAKVAEVTAGKTTEEEKVRAVYGYVGTQVRYIGVAFGIGRYQPHTATEVLENQYGDCKDKHTLLAAMLGVLGVKVDAVLIGAGIRFNPEVPSPAAFNHVITLATVGGQPTWLDTTAEIAPYRMLVATIRDHSALAIPESGVARVEKTPEALPFKQSQIMDAVGTLDKEGVADSKITLTLRGDTELYLRALLRQIPPTQYEQFVQKLSEGLGYSGTTSHAEISRPEDTAEPLTLRYDYRRVKPGDDWEHFRTIPQLSPMSLPVLDEKTPPVQATNMGGKRIENSTSALKIPEGWGVEFPEATHARSAYGNFDQTYRFDKSTMYIERKIEVLVDQVPVSEWKNYKKWTDAVYAGSDQYIQLTHTGSSKADTSKKGNGDGARLETTSNAEAANLVKSAYEAIGRRELNSAGEMLDKAKALNDTQARLWSTYGYWAYQRGEMSEAIKDYEKELALHPDAYGTYRSLAGANMNLGKTGEGIAVMRRWIAAEPSNPAATVLLVNTLLAQEDAIRAVAAAKDGIAALPEDRRLDEGVQLALGTAQVKAGMREEASVTLAALLKSTENISMLNSAAYELSLANEQLELAEASVRKALGRMGDESKAWTLDENLVTLRGKSQLLAATWDTLGWILFIEKKPAEAENFIRAAWINRSDAEVGEHLGDVLIAKGDRAGAVKVYQLALATIPPYDARGVKKDKPSAQETKLREKLKAAGGSATKDTMNAQMEAARALQELRKIPLAPAAGRSGTSEYKLLLNADGVERVERTGEKEVAGGSEMMKKAKVKGYLPEGSDARLVRVGMLNCHSEVCELMMEP